MWKIPCDPSENITVQHILKGTSPLRRCRDDVREGKGRCNAANKEEKMYDIWLLRSVHR